MRNVKYPNGIQKEYKILTSHANRGMTLEEDLNVTNEYYRESDIAIIYKKPTPITIHKVDYVSRKDAIIKDARFTIPSTTDYNGIYQGKYIDFEAKETAHKTSFPLSNIHEHQIVHLRRIIKHGGIGFLIVRFTSYDETYLLKGEDFFRFIDQEKRKSIPRTYFQKYGIAIPLGLRPRLDYLKFIEVKNETKN